MPAAVQPVHSEAMPANWAISVAGVVNAVKRYTDNLSAEAAAAERQRRAELRAQAAAQQAAEEQRQAQAQRAAQLAAQCAAEEAHRAAADALAQVELEHQRVAEEAAAAAEAELEHQRAAEEAAVAAEAQRLAAAEADRLAAAEAEQLAAEQFAAEQLQTSQAQQAESDAQAAAEQAQAAANAAAAQAAHAARTPVQMSPMEGIPEARMSAWAGGKMRAVLMATPTCIEGIPELHGSAWRQRLSNTSSEERGSGAGMAEPSIASIGATPPMLSTALAAAADQVADELANNEPLKWPSMRATSIGAHPARTPAAPPTLDAVVVPQHPIMVPSPPQAASTAAVQAPVNSPPAAVAASPSPAGSISLDGAVTAEGAGMGEVAGAADSPRSPAWFAQPTGRTPAGHANVACSAHFPTPEELADDENAMGEERSEVLPVALRSAKRTRSASDNAKENDGPDGAMDAQAHDATVGGLEGFHDADFGADGDDYFGCGYALAII